MLTLLFGGLLGANIVGGVGGIIAGALIAKYWDHLVNLFLDVFEELAVRWNTLAKNLRERDWDSFIQNIKDGSIAVLQRNFFQRRGQWYKASKIVQIDESEVPEKFRKKARYDSAQEITEEMNEELLRLKH